VLCSRDLRTYGRELSTEPGPWRYLHPLRRIKNRVKVEKRQARQLMTTPRRRWAHRSADLATAVIPNRRERPTLQGAAQRRRFSGTDTQARPLGGTRRLSSAAWRTTETDRRVVPPRPGLRADLLRPIKFHQRTVARSTSDCEPAACGVIPIGAVLDRKACSPARPVQNPLCARAAAMCAPASGRSIKGLTTTDLLNFSLSEAV